MIPPPYLHAKSSAEVLEEANSNFFKAFQFLPEEKRDALGKVYVIFHILDDCVDEMPDAQEQSQSLSFWVNEIERAYNGNPEHPISKELAEVVREFDIPKEYFLDLAKGCEMDIHKARYETFEELYDYCYRVAGLVGLTCHKIFGYESETGDEAAINLGLAFQLTNIMRDVAEDLQRDRIYIPLSFLRQFEYSEKDLQAKVYNENFKALMAHMAGIADEYFAKGTAEFKKDTENKLKASKVMAKTYGAILKKLKRKRFDVFQGKVSLGFWEKVLLMLKIWWG